MWNVGIVSSRTGNYLRKSREETILTFYVIPDAPKQYTGFIAQGKD